MELDRRDLEILNQPAMALLEQARNEEQADSQETSSMDRPFPSADAPVELIPPDKKDAGPYELDPNEAIKIALDNRLDLRIAHGRVYDAQRKVIVQADSLRPELNLLGRAGFGSGRGIGSARQQ